MPINFPVNPLTGNTYTYGGKTWVYSGNAWEIQLTVLTTSGVPEGSNLYFTNARALAAVENTLTTSSVIEGSNLYFTSARVVSSISSQTLGNATFSGNVVAGNINITGTISGNGSGIVNLPYSSVTGLTTQNVLEVINLYFTNARARAAISGGSGIIYDQANGIIYATGGGGGGGSGFAEVLIYSQP